MKPDIIESIKSGFRTAHRSFPGMIFFAGCWGAAVALGLAYALLLGLPWGDFVAYLQTRGELPAPITDWFRDRWPFLLIFPVTFTALNVWLQAGRISYLMKQTRGENAAVGDLMQGANRSFWPLLSYWLCMVLLSLGAILAASVALAGMSGLKAVLPLPVFFLMQTVIFLTAAGIGLGIFIRIQLAPYGVVVNSWGPWEAVRQSFEMTRPCWLKLLGLTALVTVIAAGVQVGSALFLGIVEGVFSSLMPAFLNRVLFIVPSLLIQILTGVYLPFVTTSAYLRFYEDLTQSSGPVKP